MVNKTKIVIVMVLAMCCHIVFSANDFRKEINLHRCTSVEIESSWKDLTDRATITLPRNIKDFDKLNVKQVFKRGDKVTISLGYNAQLNKEFTGYITEVSADIPITIKLEDEMYKLKSMPVNYASNNCYLPNLIAEIVPGYKTDVAEYNIGSVRFSQTTIAQVLKKLQEEFNLYAYFSNNKLIVGKIYADNTATHDIELDKVPENNLKYKSKEDKSLKLKATSILKGGDKIEVEIGEDGENQRQYTYYGITNKSDLKALAQKDYDKIMADGFEGDIQIFGTPFITHGDKANLTSIIYPDRNGLYYTDKTKTIWENARFRRTVTVGDKVKANG